MEKLTKKSGSEELHEGFRAIMTGSFKGNMKGTVQLSDFKKERLKLR